MFNTHSCLICTPKVGSNAEKLLFRCISHQKMKIFSIEVFEMSLIVWVNNVIKLLKNKIICRSKRKQQKKISFNWIIIVKFFYCCQIKIVKKRMYVVFCHYKVVQMIDPESRPEKMGLNFVVPMHNTHPPLLVKFWLKKGVCFSWDIVVHEIY